MTKQLLAGVAAFGLMWELCSLRVTRLLRRRSPRLSQLACHSTTTTTTVAPTTGHTTTITKGVDANGNEITKKVTYREGITGSSETHTKTFTDPDCGTTTTRSKTTTTEE
jgi:hypothetical protein